MNETNNDYINFEKDVENTIAIYKKTVGGFAPNTERILFNQDKIGALSKLMQSGDVQKGFKILRNNKQLDKTFESLILKYKHLFKNDVVVAAQWRLNNAWKMEN
jgi:hypothetical protein